ncbi:GSCOCG00006992001-RA-CDS [Cotesia congregata]|nr:GSCOCG00006992001-RA-CDS [Cotesia congregata]
MFYCYVTSTPLAFPYNSERSFSHHLFCFNFIVINFFNKLLK